MAKVRNSSFAWRRKHRHFDLDYAVSGMGAVLHTIKPWLFLEQLAYMAQHAEGQDISADLAFARGPLCA